MIDIIIVLAATFVLFLLLLAATWKDHEACRPENEELKMNNEKLTKTGEKSCKCHPLKQQ